MKSLPVYLGIALLTAVHPSGCGNECDFLERCDGTVLQTCGEGVDQCVKRRISEEVCAAPNGACAFAGARATCARSPVVECDRSFTPRCDGALVLRCSVSPQGFVVAEDCGVAGQTCVTRSSGEVGCGAEAPRQKG